jgi:hypothetical protein
MRLRLINLFNGVLLGSARSAMSLLDFARRGGSRLWQFISGRSLKSSNSPSCSTQMKESRAPAFPA